MEVVIFEGNGNAENLIKTSLEKQTLIPVVGAGFTRGMTAKSGLVPSTKELEDIMIKGICEKDKEISPQDFKDENYLFDRIATEYLSTVDNEDYISLLEDRFTKVSLDENRRKFINIRWPYTYTLNIDDAIERNTGYKPILPYKELRKNLANEKHVYKVHGC